MARQKKIKVREIKSKIKVTEIAEEEGELESDADDELDAPVRRGRFESSGGGGGNAPVLNRMNIEQEQADEPTARAERDEGQTAGVRYTSLMAGGYEGIRRREEKEGGRYEAVRAGATVGATPTLTRGQAEMPSEGQTLFRKGLREEMGEDEKYKSKMDEHRGEKRSKHPWE